ncbi:hypothetical protein HYALB_00004544 [Hymenoscyphus albidus]|uniref:Uncharacterized protein n=1 Tax=Hymenoscyphus albidus TaxID=595503 RepID=A0A9N9QD20_9HELO|nr:hypothetical protein HYALB_00004544 [Hymenoscyphus albidus]
MASAEFLAANDGSKTGNEGEASTISSPSLVLIDENRWAEQLRQQKCMQNLEAKLTSRVEKFLELASPPEQTALKESQDQLRTLMEAAKKEDQLKNPDYGTTPMPTSQRFKEHYNSFVQSGYGLSKHIDLFVGQAPEYVSLVWGAIKILMIAQINNQELKENVHSHLKNIARIFELVDQLPDLIPQKNLVEAVSEAYGLFSKFLAKAVKYHSECRAPSSWKIRSQDIVDEIDSAIVYINEITQARSYITAETNLAISGQILQANEKMWDVIKNLPEAILNLGAELKAVQFEKSIDVYQTTSMMQQRLEERFSNPNTASAPAEPVDDEKISPLGGDILDIFTDLRDFEAEKEQAEETKFVPETTEQRTKRRNMLQSDEIITWIESERSQLLWIDGSYLLSRSYHLASFITPLTIDAACNYELITILKHFCSSSHSTRNSCLALLQALVSQIIKQHPEVAEGDDAKISRSKLPQAAKDFTKLWELLKDCLTVKSHHDLHRVYIIIESIDELQSVNMDNYNILMLRLHDLIRQDGLLVKILLSSRVLPGAPVASDISNSLSVPHRKWALLPFEENMPMLQRKFSEIQEGRCKSITFPQLVLIYPPKTLIYTKVGDAFQAYVIFEISGATETMPGRFDPLHLRVWSVDHNGTYFTKRYLDLDITQFSGSRELKDLRYIPAGYLPDESRVRNMLVERGRRYWELAEEPQYCYSSERDFSHVMVDQGYQTLHEVSQQELDDQFQKTQAGDLKAMISILCPHIIRAYELNSLKWIEAEIGKLSEAGPYKNMHRIKMKHEGVLWANMATYISQFHGRKSSTSYQADFVIGKRMGLIMLLHGQSIDLEQKNACSKFGLPLLVITMGTLVNSADMDTQLQEYMELALRWGEVLYFENIDRLSEMGSGPITGSINVEVTFYHRLRSFQGIAALSVSKDPVKFSLDPLKFSNEFKKFIPVFRVAFKVVPPNDNNLWVIWEECSDQIAYNGDRTEFREWIEEYGSEGSTVLDTRVGIMNICHNVSAQAGEDRYKLEPRNFINAMKEAKHFWAVNTSSKRSPPSGK